MDEIRMTRENRIRNEYIIGRINMASIVDKKDWDGLNISWGKKNLKQ